VSNLNIRRSTLSNLTDERFLRFLQRFSDDFQENSSLSHSPWCYFELAHFHFEILHSPESVIAVRVTSTHLQNEHLNFLYVDIDHRSSGFGEQLLIEWLTHRQKDLLTIHVKTELVRTQEFYKKLGFEVISLTSPAPAISPWITQCLRFNPQTYQHSVLMARQFEPNCLALTSVNISK
jgi:N-acetylglutamate synthase-like GNAT family acetyltransferase